MAVKETKKINATQGAEMKLPCSKCDGKTYHKVLLSLDQEGEDEHESGYVFSWDVHHQIVQCQGCKTISFRKCSSNSEDTEPDDDGGYECAIFEDLYPSRVEGRKGLDEDVRHLPSKVQRIYSETLQALNSQSPILAGIGLRALVETVCEEKSAEGSNLMKKIDDLTAKGILTPAGTKILHKIRTLGNAAAHEVKPHSEKQLGIALDVIEHLLIDVYILPKQVESVFDEEREQGSLDGMQWNPGSCSVTNISRISLRCIRATS